MKKTIAFSLFCVIFALIPSFVCFAQDWGDTGFSNNNDDFDDEGTSLDSIMIDDSYDNGISSDATASSTSKDVAAAVAAAEAAANSAESAAAAATAAAESAAFAAESAESASANAAVSAGTPSSPALPQPPVRIVIPMMAAPPAAPPARPAPPPAYSTPPAYSAPPAHPAPLPTYRHPSINVIPAMPNPNSNSIYRVQVGAFSSPGLAQQCFARLLTAGFSPIYEPYNNVNRIVLMGIRAGDVALIVQRLAAAGFGEVWIREEK